MCKSGFFTETRTTYTYAYTAGEWEEDSNWHRLSRVTTNDGRTGRRAFYHEGLEIEVVGDLVSKSYVDMTIAGLADFGVKVENEDYKYLRVAQGQSYESREYIIEGDASGASYFFASAAINQGSVKVYNLSLESLLFSVHLSSHLLMPLASYLLSCIPKLLLNFISSMFMLHPNNVFLHFMNSLGFVLYYYNLLQHSLGCAHYLI